MKAEELKSKIQFESRDVGHNLTMITAKLEVHFPQDVYQSRTIADAAARITSPSFYIEAKMFRVSTAALAEHIISIIPNAGREGTGNP